MYKCYLFIKHSSIKWICIIYASCSTAAAIPGSSVAKPACVVWCSWSVSLLGILFLLTIQLVLINFLFYPTVLHAYSHEPCHIRAALVNEGYGSHPFPLKELNKILSMTCKEQGINWNTNCFRLTLLWWERGAEEFTRDVFQEISPSWTLDVTEVGSLCSASLCLSRPSAPHCDVCLKGHYKESKWNYYWIQSSFIL